MIAQAHAIISQLIHQLGRQFTFVIGIKQTPLQLIHPVNPIAVLRPRAPLQWRSPNAPSLQNIFLRDYLQRCNRPHIY